MAIWELVGVAGCGKTTLKRSLTLSPSVLQGMPSLRRPMLVPIWIYAGLKAVACYYAGRNRSALHPPHIDIFRRSYRYKVAELRAIATIIVMYFVLQSVAQQRNSVFLLDQGPIYLLAFLEAMGTTIERPGVARLCSVYLRKLKKIYSGVAHLKANDEALDTRRKRRADWAKYMSVMNSEENIRAHHDDYKNIYEKLIKDISDDGSVIVVTLRSDEAEMLELSRRLMAIIEGAECERSNHRRTT